MAAGCSGQGSLFLQWFVDHPIGDSEPWWAQPLFNIETLPGAEDSLPGLNRER